MTTMINSSSIAMQTRTAALPSIPEKVCMLVKTDRMLQMTRTASKGIATSTATKIRFSPSGICPKSEALLAARRTKITYIAAKTVRPALIMAFPELRFELLLEVSRVAPTMKRTSAIVAPS